MHINSFNRTVVAGVLLTLLVPALGLADTVVTSLRSTNAQDAQTLTQQLLKDRKQQVQNLASRKRYLRLHIVRLNQEIAVDQKRLSGALLQLETTQVDLDSETKRLLEFIRYVHLRQQTTTDVGPRAVRTLFSTMIGRTLGQQVDDDLRSTALRRAREELLSSLQGSTIDEKRLLIQLDSTVVAMSADLEKTRKQYADVQKKYDEAFRGLQVALGQADVSDEAKQEERAVVADIRGEVARAQEKLQRLQVRSERDAERDLFRLKLFDPRPGTHLETASPADKLDFMWPVNGPVSAGFNDASYLKHFGFPHHAVDIVTYQGTPVQAAAKGVVFVVRDGGAKGFSYILLGHANGYTTLYGHLSVLSVQAGQEIDKGQVIGYSGGTPGTHGAGPSTTGPHLHFEVTQNGVYVNPITVLP